MVAFFLALRDTKLSNIIRVASKTYFRLDVAVLWKGFYSLPLAEAMRLKFKLGLGVAKDIQSTTGNGFDLDPDMLQKMVG